MSSQHAHNFKDLPTDWRHDGPLSTRNDEKHLPSANAKPTPGALSAAKFIEDDHHWGRMESQRITNRASIIDHLAVKPATEELLAALKKMLLYAEHSTQGQSAIKTESRGRSLTKSQADFLNDAMAARAAIAKHEGRT